MTMLYLWAAWLSGAGPRPVPAQVWTLVPRPPQLYLNLTCIRARVQIGLEDGMIAR
jgi:hypothetical protein